MSRPPSLLYALVALSGAAALVYELLWIRALGLSFGTTTPAIATVVATFMAGLGAGNLLFGRRADRSPRPFRLYWKLELGIAATGLGVSLSLLRGGAWLDAWSRACEQAGAWSGLLRALTFAVLLLGPATLIGGTLPVLTSALARRGNSARVLASLYACNTLGAIAGALLPDFVSIPRYGLSSTAVAAAACNLCIALGARWLDRPGALYASVGDAAHAEPTEVDPLGEAFGEASTRRSVALALAACCGFVGMALEVAWSRTVQHWTAALITSFAVLLAVYLGAFGIGTLAARRIAERSTDPLRAATSLLAAAAISVLAPLASAYPWRDFERALWPRPAAVHRLGLWREAVDALLHATFLEAVPCLLLGASFPFVAADFMRDRRPGQSAAQLLTASTLAGVVGAPAMAFGMLPAFGEQGSYCALALLSCAVAALGSAALPGRSLARSSGVVAFTLAIAVVWMLPGDALQRASFRSGAHVIAVREGSTTTAAAALRTVYGQPYYAELLTPGVSMSNTGPPARRYMAMMAHAAMLTARRDERALLICYGVGNTASALLSYPSLKRLDVVDIAREVLGLAPMFGRALGRNPLRDPRAHVHVDDGRHHLIVHGARYDVITAEPPPPTHAGVVNLYSREFYRLARRRLRPGGVVTQWLPVFQLSDAEVRAMIAAFVAELPHTALLHGYKEHLILIGSSSPLAIDAARARLAGATPAVARDLLRSGVGDVDDVIGSVVRTDAELRRDAAGVAPVSDDRPSIQYPRENVRRGSTYIASLSVTRAHALALLDPRADQATQSAVLSASRATAASLAALPLLELQPQELAELSAGARLQPALFARPNQGGLRTLLGIDHDHVAAAQAATRGATPPRTDATWTLARSAFYAGRYAQALELLSRLEPVAEDRALHALLRAGCLRALGRPTESEGALRQAAQASHDTRFISAVGTLLAHVADPFPRDAGPWSSDPVRP